MVVYLDEKVFDQIKSDGVITDLSGKYVIAHRGHDQSESTTDPKLNIGLAIHELDVRCAVGFVVTDNEGGTDGEDSNELAAERCDSLEDAIHCMVNGTDGQTEVTFFTELCADYGNVILGLARWAHPSRFEDGRRWF